MDDAIVIAPAKKRKTETDYQKCVICQKKLATEALVAIPKHNSIVNLLNLSRERHKYGDTALAEFVQRTVNETALIIREKNGSYHRSCYKEFPNRSKLDRVINRFQKAVQHKKPRYLRIKLVDHCLGQFLHQLMRVIPQGHLDHPLEYLIRQCALFVRNLEEN